MSHLEQIIEEFYELMCSYNSRLDGQFVPYSIDLLERYLILGEECRETPDSVIDNPLKIARLKKNADFLFIGYYFDAIVQHLDELLDDEELMKDIAYSMLDLGDVRGWPREELFDIMNNSIEYGVGLSGDHPITPQTMTGKDYN